MKAKSSSETFTWQHCWRLTRMFAARDFQGRFKGTFFGIGTALIRPLAILAIDLLVFGYVFDSRFGKISGETRSHFAVGLFVGIITFELFSEAVSRAPSVITGSPNLVTKVVFPVHVLPLSLVASSLVQFALSLLPLAGALVFLRPNLSWSALLFPLWLVPLVMLTAAGAMAVSALGVYLREIGTTIQPILMVIMYASCIFYPIVRVPPPFRQVIELNPLALCIDQMRDLLVWGLDFQVFAFSYCFCFSLVCVVLAGWFFGGVREGFSEVM
jgi:lipopolysaccharide transport system permease protein